MTVSLSEQMGAMALVDELRHQELAQQEHLDLPKQRSEVSERIRSYYQSNGIHHEQTHVEQGVRAFFAQRLVFEAPPLSRWERLLVRLALSPSLLIPPTAAVLAVGALSWHCLLVGYDRTMTPDTLFIAIDTYTRSTLLAQREAEEDLREAIAREVRLECLMTEKLNELASFQMEHGPELDPETRQLLAERESAQAELHDHIDRLQRLIKARLETQRHLQTRIGTLETQARTQLEKDPAYLSLTAHIRRALDNEPQAELAYVEIRDECRAKLVAYWNNPIFRALVLRDYATERYRPRLLRTWLDDFLARKVSFQVNQANEQMLQAMLDRNEVQREQRMRDREQMGREHQAYLDEAYHRLGLPALWAQDDALDHELSEAKAEVDAWYLQLSAFNQGRDRNLQRIREQLTAKLKTRPLAQLMQHAAATPDEADDALVSELQGLHPRLLEQQEASTRLLQVRDRASFDHQRALALDRALRNDFYQDRNSRYITPRPIRQFIEAYQRGEMDLQAIKTLLTSARPLIDPSRPGSG